MSGSGASNLGYGNIVPFSNFNKNYVNVYNTNNPSSFGSNEIPGLPGISGTKNNIDAAAGIFKGGAKKFKKKIKNITKKYKKMKIKSKKMTSFKNRIKKIFSKRSKKGFLGKKKNKKSSYRNKTQKGGYSQYQNNLPYTPTYSVGGVLPASQLGLANPPPIKLLEGCTNCVDNYNHFTGKGFPSKGH